MSENEEIMNETENETMAAEVEAVETVETEAAEVEAADEVSAEEAEVVEAAVDYDDEELMDKMQKAARLLRSRRFAISKEEEAKAERMANIERAIKLLDLKPKMEQKEMSDLLGMRLRELDGLMAEARHSKCPSQPPWLPIWSAASTTPRAICARSLSSLPRMPLRAWSSLPTRRRSSCPSFLTRRPPS